MKIFLSFLVFFHLILSVTAQSDQRHMDSLLFSNHIYSNSIKTVQLFKKGWPLTYPVIALNSQEKLILSFDELSDDVGDYYYTFIHCGAGWTNSFLTEAEYIEGFPENQISDYRFSYNTSIKYIHYKLSFPNEDVKFKISGNYILMVYQNYNKSEPIITYRFMVVEDLVDVQMTLTRPAIPQFRDTGQEVHISVKYSKFAIFDPYSEVKIMVTQNGRWDNASFFSKPSFVRAQEIVYDFDRKNIFFGGNEYRYFDIKSLRYQTEYVKNIDFKHPYFHVQLFPSKPKNRISYFYNDDINGKYYIKIQEGVEDDIEADYVKVYFTLNMNFPDTRGEVYIFGALSNWNCKPDNHMMYNSDTRAYEGSLLLKQGYYTYEYVMKEKGIPFANNTIIEGSHFETENDYSTFVYFRPSGARHDRLIGFALGNSLIKPR